MYQNGRSADIGDARRLSLRQAWRAAVRNPLLAIGFPTALLAATLLFVRWAAPVYESSARIRIDEQRSGVAILEALQTLSSGSKISTEMEELRSRTLAEEVVDSLDLHVGVRQPRKLARHQLLASLQADRMARAARYTFERRADGAYDVSASNGARTIAKPGVPVQLAGVRLALAPGATKHERIVIEVAPFQEAVLRFGRTIGVSRPNREADFITIRYEGQDRQVVRAVPNLLARRFMVSRNDVRTREARGTAEFLSDQIDTLVSQLGVTEDELRNYRERYGVIALEAEGEAQVTRLADMQADRERMDAERGALDQALREIAGREVAANEPSPYRALLGFPSLLRNAATADLLRSLHELEAERARFLDRRTLADPEVKTLTNQINAIEGQLHMIAQTYLSGTAAQVRNLDQTLAGFARELQRIPEKELRVARLRRQMEVSEELYTQLQLRLKEAEIVAAAEDPTVRMVDASILPRKPIKPNIPLSVALALLFGTLLGAGSAVLKEQIDNTVRTRDELQLVGGVPVLGSIPRIARANGGERHRFRRHHVDRVVARLVEDEAGSPVTEAYRSLRTNINFAQIDSRPRVLVVTSPAPGDGKSTTAVNLAYTMTKQGLRCLLVDADLRRGMLHELFEKPREPGLADVLFGQNQLEDVMHTAAGEPDFITTGTLPPTPAELLGSKRMAELIARARDTYDTIVLDAPPLNLVTDAAVLARIADGVVVVARAGVTPRNAIAYTFEQLSGVRAHVLGTVLNDTDLKRENHYGSYMRGYYQADTKHGNGAG